MEVDLAARVLLGAGGGLILVTLIVGVIEQRRNHMASENLFEAMIRDADLPTPAVTPPLDEPAERRIERAEHHLRIVRDSTPSPALNALAARKAAEARALLTVTAAQEQRADHVSVRERMARVGQ